MENKPEEQSEKEKAIRKCGCICHQPDSMVMHCAPCCDYTYQTLEGFKAKEEGFQFKETIYVDFHGIRVRTDVWAKPQA